MRFRANPSGVDGQQNSLVWVHPAVQARTWGAGPSERSGAAPKARHDHGHLGARDLS